MKEVRGVLNRIRRSTENLRQDHGATAVEYALMAAMIAMVIIAAVIVLGTSLSSIFDAAGTGI